MSGDSHASWVSDLVWLDNEPYNSTSGAGALGAEFAGSAVSSPCPYGENITLAKAANYSQLLVGANAELQWQDLYYRGYFELHISEQEVAANYFGMPTIVTRNPDEISLANFTVKAGANKLTRPIAGGVAEAGYLRGGQVQRTNVTNDTSTGQYFVSHPDLNEVQPY